MPNQTRIIDAVNNILRRHGHSFRLNIGGVCAGLAVLNIKYQLMGKGDQFDTICETIASLPDDHDFGRDPRFTHFITDLQRAFSPRSYTRGTVQQGDVLKLIDFNGSPPRVEYNIGIIADSDTWASLFDSMRCEGRIAYLASHNHAISIQFVNGAFKVYDPNYPGKNKVFKEGSDLVKELGWVF